jgi:hypothetical protein
MHTSLKAMTATTNAALDRLLVEAQSSRQPVSLETARTTLGDLFDERELADQTLVLRGDDIALSPSAWYRLVRQAASRPREGSHRC